MTADQRSVFYRPIFGLRRPDLRKDLEKYIQQLAEDIEKAIDYN